MSSFYLSIVWSESRAKGSHKLVMLAFAEHADRNGQAELSLRDIALLCGLSKSRVEEIIRALVELGELRIRSAGSGRGNPTRYSITLQSSPAKRPEDDKAYVAPDKSPVVGDLADKAEPEKPLPTVQPQETSLKTVKAKPSVPQKPQTIGAFEAITQADVDAILKAADISPPDDQPFYWSRKEHRDDLTTLLMRYGHPIEKLCAELRRTISEGKVLQHRPRRLTELSALLGKGVA